MASPSLLVAIPGATGFLGRRLVDALTGRGHRVVGLTRGDPPPATASTRWERYDPLDAASVGRAIEGADVVVNLAGEPVFGRRWTKAVMQRIRDSRVEGTKAVVTAIGKAAKRPSTLLNASAIGYYGPRPATEVVTEASPPGDDFLAQVCREWEGEALRAKEHGVRVALSRTGIVLAPEGGALAKMLFPFKACVGGPIGDGTQGMSWIHVADQIGLLVRAIEDPAWAGPFDATAPNPVSNREFSKALGRALHRPAFVRTPRFALKLLFGRAADVLATGQYVRPEYALGRGYEFRFPTVDGALTDLLDREPASAESKPS